MLYENLLSYLGAKAFSNRYTEKNNSRQYYNSLQDAKDKLGIKMDDVDIANFMAEVGIIDKDKYGTALNALQDYSKAYKESKANALGYSFTEWLTATGHTGKTAREVGELYRILEQNIDKVYSPENLQEIVNGLGANTPLAPYAPAPTLFNLDDYNPIDLPVDPVRMWTGQELANLHGIDYNFDNYYDLMKQGSQAQVALKNYENQQANTLGALQDEDVRVSYLDALRNNRTQAMNKGISAGQKAANELLAMQDAMNQYSTNQSGIVNNQMSNIEPAINNDAYIKRTAQDFYQNLVHNMGGLSNGLYTIDNNRYGSDVTSAADIYRRGLETKGVAMRANADMLAQQQLANAQIATVNQGIQNQNNMYAWLFNNELTANGGNAYAAAKNVMDFIYSGYTNGDLDTYIKNLYSSK